MTCHRRGFTLIEMMVASIVATTALIGVYGLLQDSLRIERNEARRWNDRAAAEALVTGLASEVELGVQIDDVPAIVGKADQDGVYRLTFTSCVPAAAAGADGSSSGMIRKSRYQWPAQAGGSDRGDTLSAAGFAVLRQRLELAGKTRIGISSAALSPGPQGDRDPFGSEPLVVVANRISDLSVRFRRADEPSGAWSAEPPTGGVKMLVRITAQCGSQRVERIVRPAADAPLLGKGDG